MDFKTISESVLDVCNSVFGESVTYTPLADVPVTINAVFNNVWIEVESVTSLTPTLRVQLSDLASVPGKGDQVVVGSINYKVTKSHPDGFGGSTLILQKV
jgi:hypothetical protein